MLLVDTVIRPSHIEGIGLFAAQDIKAGEIIWQMNTLIDVVLSKDDVICLPPAVKAFIMRYGFSEDGGSTWIICGDNGCFVNHSDRPNAISLNGMSVAAVDIRAACH